MIRTVEPVDQVGVVEFAAHHAAQAFWHSVGYGRSEVVSFGRRLDAKDSPADS